MRDSAASGMEPREGQGRRADSARLVDVAILASASVRSITFASQPEVRVTLCGGLDSVRVLERRNLPNPVIAGTTYRDVYVAVEILGRVDAACLTDRLLRARDSTRNRAAVAPECASISVHGIAPPDPSRASRASPP